MPAWTPDRARRAIRSPKAYLVDSGLAAALGNVDAEAIARDRNLLGGLLETFVASEVLKLASWSDVEPDVHHYRTHDGAEIDFVLESRDGRRVAIEVKSGATVARRDLRTLADMVANPASTFVRGVVLYGGDTVLPIAENVHVVPIANLWRS